MRKPILFILIVLGILAIRLSLPLGRELGRMVLEDIEAPRRERDARIDGELAAWREGLKAGMTLEPVSHSSRCPTPPQPALAPQPAR